MILQTAVLSVLLCSVHSFTLQAPFEKSDGNSGNNMEDEDVGIAALLEKANANVGNNSDEPLVMFGDIAVPVGLQNADPCTARNCLWPKANDGNVYVPYRISNQYCKYQKAFYFGSLSQLTHINPVSRQNMK
ncbi:high choriolytic enzyme 2-like [Embiotoca jacksoni]|uniref:high choriolytic enzyme 2-like n=1 Tax=Embiotoca jacksoni TaxID=100190 RepID=UPI00370461F5